MLFYLAFHKTTTKLTVNVYVLNQTSDCEKNQDP